MVRWRASWRCCPELLIDSSVYQTQRRCRIYVAINCIFSWWFPHTRDWSFVFPPLPPVFAVKEINMDLYCVRYFFWKKYCMLLERHVNISWRAGTRQYCTREHIYKCCKLPVDQLLIEPNNFRIEYIKFFSTTPTRKHTQNLRRKYDR
jgi:hypothetical protein